MKIKLNKYKIYFSVLALLFSFQLKSQDVLGEYIIQALDSNLTVQKSDFELNKRFKDIQIARSYYYPAISLFARYTIADGGRTIDFPVGDLLNPVYQNLNANNDLLYFLMPNMKPPEYPTINNQSFNFYRDREHETKAQLDQPVFSPEIYFNTQIKKDLYRAEIIKKDIVEIEIVAEIKKSYFLYLKTVKLTELLENTEKILIENIRVNQKLFENDKVTKDVIYNSELELQKLKQQQSIAKKNRLLAKSYFNFLLNSDLESEIKIDTNIAIGFTNFNLKDLQDTASLARYELKLLDVYDNLADKKLKLYKSKVLPNLYASVNYGYQGEEYKFDNDHDFVLASLVLQWNLFSGLQNTREIQKAQIEKQSLNLERQESLQKIKLEIRQAYLEMQASREALQSADLRSKSAKEAFKIIDKKYSNGQASLLEFMNARNEMTSAQLNRIITQYDYLSQQAEFERVTMSLKFY